MRLRKWRVVVKFHRLFSSLSELSLAATMATRIRRPRVGLATGRATPTWREPFCARRVAAGSGGQRAPGRELL